MTVTEDTPIGTKVRYWPEGIGVNHAHERYVARFVRNRPGRGLQVRLGGSFGLSSPVAASRCEIVESRAEVTGGTHDAGGD